MHAKTKREVKKMIELQKMLKYERLRIVKICELKGENKPWIYGAFVDEAWKVQAEAAMTSGEKIKTEVIIAVSRGGLMKRAKKVWIFQRFIDLGRFPGIEIMRLTLPKLPKDKRTIVSYGAGVLQSSELLFLTVIENSYFSARKKEFFTRQGAPTEEQLSREDFEETLVNSELGNFGKFI